MQLLIVILDNLGCLPDLLKAWQKIGVPGVTILESVGGFRASSWLSQVGLGALDRLFEAKEVRRRTLMAAFEDEALLAQAIAEAERLVGGFAQPNSGLLLVLPVTHAKGLFKVAAQSPEAVSPPAVLPDWLIRRDTLIEQVASILNLEATIVPPEMPLDEVARAMLAQPNVQVACVVDEEERLVGLLDLNSLADDVFFHILPEEYLSEVTDLEHVMDFAKKSRLRNAADAMLPPAWVKKGDTVKDAFKRLHKHKMPGLPVVDELYKVVGYINLLELLAVCLERKEEAGDEQAGER